MILWELNVLDEQFITFYCDHALFDGNSGTFFHDLLLKELSKLDGEQLEYQDILFTNLEPSIPTPQLNERALALYNPPMLFVVSKIVEILFMPTVIKRSVARIWSWIYGKDYLNTFDYPKFQYKPCQKGDPTHFKLISFTPAEVTKMITNCKLHGLTLTPYLIAIGVQCLQQSVLKKVSNNAEYSSEVNISINNRRYLPEESANEVGLLISGVDLKIPPLNPNEPLVGVMKSVSSQLQDLVEQNHGSKIVGLLKYVKVLDFLKSKVGIHSRQTMELSNLGNKNFKHGSWEVENLFFSQSNGVASHFALSTVSTLKLGMNISFGYLEDYIEFPDEIANFVKTFKDKVINFDE